MRELEPSRVRSESWSRRGFVARAVAVEGSLRELEPSRVRTEMWSRRGLVARARVVEGFQSDYGYGFANIIDIAPFLYLQDRENKMLQNTISMCV